MEILLGKKVEIQLSEVGVEWKIFKIFKFKFYVIFSTSTYFVGIKQKIAKDKYSIFILSECENSFTKEKVILKFAIGVITITNNTYILLMILLVPASAVRCVVNTANPAVNCKS